jgi:hypothetical protein
VIDCHDDFWRRMAADPEFRQQMIDRQRDLGWLSCPCDMQVQADKDE